MNDAELLKYDIRARERLLAAGVLKPAEVEAYLESLPDLADRAEPILIEQPALLRPEGQRRSSSSLASDQSVRPLRSEPPAKEEGESGGGRDVAAENAVREAMAGEESTDGQLASTKDVQLEPGGEESTDGQLASTKDAQVEPGGEESTDGQLASTKDAQLEPGATEEEKP